ncbi:DegT/DnrJ/EryC1/StrS family aminotransferase [soil metagenome]
MIRLTRPLLPSLDAFNLRLEKIWKEEWLTNRGNQCLELENKLGTYLGCQNLSLFCNGTIALLLGLKALKLSGEVITTPFTFPATTHAIDWAGLSPVFADIDPKTLTIDPKKVEEAITDRTTAILAVHVFGIPCDVHALEAIARKYQLKLIYDAAHAFGTEVDGMPIGNFGDLSMFSLHATKLFHTAEGGALVYKDAALKSELHYLHNFGIKDEDTVVSSGINGKMNELQAALGLCVLDLVEVERQKRALIVERYTSNLEALDDVAAVLPLPSVRSSYQYMPIIIKAQGDRSRDSIFYQLRAKEILARRYFRPLCTKTPCYANLPSASACNLPIAEVIDQQILCLPLHGDLSNDDVDHICDIISH